MSGKPTEAKSKTKSLAPVSARGLHVAALAPALVAAFVLLVLHLRLTFHGQNRSGDLMIYARSLWGVAHGDLWNSVLNDHVFAIHAHVLQIALVPFVYVFKAATVLIWAQAISFGALWFIVARAFQKAALEAGLSRAWRVYASGVWGAALVVLGTILVLNPYMYDARPDFLGTPFLAWGLLQAVERGHFTRKALVAMFVGMLAREEYGVVIAATLALAPVADVETTKRTRFGLAASGLAWFAIYYFGVRPWLGSGTQGSVLVHLQGDPEGATDAASFVHYKLLLLITVVLAGGGLCLRGWRWWGAVVVGLGVLFVSRWMLVDQLKFHYSFLAIPGLCAMALDGFRRWLRGPKRNEYWIYAWTGLALVDYAAFANAPGGRLFDKYRFDMLAEDGSLAFSLEPIASHESIHKRLEAIPADHGVAVQVGYGAPLADRHYITSTFHVSRVIRTSKTQEIPAELTTVAILTNEKAEREEFARFLVRRGFRLADYTGGAIELLTRDHAFMHTPWETISVTPPPSCRSPLGRASDVGLDVCEIDPSVPAPNDPSRGVARAVVMRSGPADDPGARETTALNLIGGRVNVRMRILGGLVDLADLPVRRAVELFADSPVPVGAQAHFTAGTQHIAAPGGR